MWFEKNRRFYLRFALWICVPLIMGVGFLLFALRSDSVTLTAYDAILLGMPASGVDQIFGIPPVSSDGALMELTVDSARSINSPLPPPKQGGDIAKVDKFACWNGDGATIWVGEDANGSVVWKQFSTVPRQPVLARIWHSISHWGA